MPGALVCAHCGQKIIGNGYRYLGKVYCGACYEKAMQESMALEAAKEELFGYVKNLFGKTDCPPEVIYMVEQNLKTGKKIKGIRATIYYYYEVKGHEPNNIFFLGKVISEQYENARQYVEECARIAEVNRLTNLVVAPNNVKVRQPRRKKEIKYKMEDL